MLNHVDPRLAALERRAAGHFDTVGRIGGNPRAAGQVRPDEDDPRAGLGRPELQADVAAAPISEAFDHGRPGEGALLASGEHQ